MKLTFIFILLTSLAFGQKKGVVFYNEAEEEISQAEFAATKNYRENLDIYLENDSTIIALLIAREKFGYLDKSSFNDLKSYLTNISGKEIDSAQYIVINYLTPLPKKADTKKSWSTWNVLDRDYPWELRKIANINQFWVHSPECDNLEFYRPKRINWIADKENVFKKLFFPYDIIHGNFLLIKPDGKFYYYLGEHSKYEIWDKARKYFR